MGLGIWPWDSWSAAVPCCPSIPSGCWRTLSCLSPSPSTRSFHWRERRGNSTEKSWNIFKVLKNQAKVSSRTTSLKEASSGWWRWTSLQARALRSTTRRKASALHQCFHSKSSRDCRWQQMTADFAPRSAASWFPSSWLPSFPAWWLRCGMVPSYKGDLRQATLQKQTNKKVGKYLTQKKRPCATHVASTTLFQSVQGAP